MITRRHFFFQTNVGDVVPLNSSHPLRVDFSKTNNEPSPYLLVRKNLEGLISRNVFYQLVQEASINQVSKELYIESSGIEFSLGKVE